MPHDMRLAHGNPFRLQNGVRDAIPHPAWQCARTMAMDMLREGGRAMLVGPPGCGKSLLLKDLAQALPGAGQRVRLVSHPNGIGRASDPNEVLLVDEADGLSCEQLAQVTAGRGPLLLAVVPVSPLLQNASLRSFVRIGFDPLGPEAVARFVVARLAVAGLSPGLLDAMAVLRLAQHSGGSIRLVNAIASSAVFLAGLDGSARVTAAHVDEAAAMRDTSAPEPAVSLARGLGISVTPFSSASTRIVSPLANLPRRSSSDSGSSIRVVMTRRNGRAP